jgi:hypothetical protein
MKRDGKEKNPIIFHLFEDKISQNGKRKRAPNPSGGAKKR